jgi:hypothetical protein
MEPIYRIGANGTLTQLETQGADCDLHVFHYGDDEIYVWARNLACAAWIAEDYWDSDPR